MKIHFERSGGLAGRTIRKIIDSNALPPEEAKKLHEMVQAAQVLKLPKCLKQATQGADRFEYTLIFELEEGRHAVELDDAAAPPSLRPLLAWLRSR